MSRLWEKMVGNDWENSLKGPNSSKSLPNCLKMSQNVPKCPLQTHRCLNELVSTFCHFSSRSRDSPYQLPLQFRRGVMVPHVDARRSLQFRWAIENCGTCDTSYLLPSALFSIMLWPCFDKVQVLFFCPNMSYLVLSIWCLFTCSREYLAMRPCLNTKKY